MGFPLWTAWWTLQWGGRGNQKLYFSPDEVKHVRIAEEWWLITCFLGLCIISSAALQNWTIFLWCPCSAAEDEGLTYSPEPMALLRCLSIASAKMNATRGWHAVDLPANWTTLLLAELYACYLCWANFVLFLCYQFCFTAASGNNLVLPLQPLAVFVELPAQPICVKYLLCG